MTARPAIRFDRPSIRSFTADGIPTVYRLYLEDGRLLYVGATVNPRTRLLEHLRNPEMEWLDPYHKGADSIPAAWVELVSFKTTTSMARAEHLAMATEYPLIKTTARRHATWKAQPKRSKSA